MPRITFVNGVAPAKPTSFSDGSYQFPGASLSYASYGTWEPYREYATIHPEEHDFATPLLLYDNRRNGGLMMGGIIQGVYNSSTRAELAGVISALPKPGGIHLALDNRGVVDRCNAILAGTYARRRPWQLIDDGDLWELFEKAATARGLHSIKLTWVKAHASWDYIFGSQDHANTVGNSQADMAAELAYSSADARSEHQQVLEFHALKQQAYFKLVVRLQAFAASLIQKDKELRREAGLKDQGKHAQHFIIEAPAIPTRIDFSFGSSLNLLPLPIHMTQSHLELHTFWNNLRWSCEDSARPTSWIELFVFL